MSGPRTAALSLGLAFMTFLSGCTHSSDGDPLSKLDRELRRLATTQPDSIAGVLVRIEPPLDEARRDSLRARGLDVRSLAGAVLTGSVRAGDAEAVARLPFVVRIDLARQVPMHRSTL